MISEYTRVFGTCFSSVRRIISPSSQRKDKTLKVDQICLSVCLPVCPLISVRELTFLRILVRFAVEVLYKCRASVG
jgi:hypothetical protein